MDPQGRPRAAVLFDLDGVLIDSEGLQYEAYRGVLERFGVRISREEYAVEWIANGKGPEYAVARYRLPLQPDELRELKNPVYHRLLREKITLMPGAREVLERLGRSFPLALATNSSAIDAGYVLDRFGIRSRFDSIVTRERYDRPKPEPDAYRTAAGSLGFPPHSCVVVEDALKGVLAAHRAGCPCIAVPNAFTRGTDFRLAAAVLPSLDAIDSDLVLSLIAGK